MRIRSLFAAGAPLSLLGRGSWRQSTRLWFSDAAPSLHRQIRIRHATFNDILLIDKCNRATLPENYTFHYLHSQLERWDQLSLVAETDEKDFVGYAFGQVDTIEPSIFDVGVVPAHSIGHISSVAVYEKYRGRGVARQLVQRLHKQFASVYGIDCVNLYVRPNNVPAVHLYASLGYVPDRLLQQYYADQEDALIMKKALPLL